MSKSITRTTITMQHAIHAKGIQRQREKGHRNFSLYLEDLVKVDTGLNGQVPPPSHNDGNDKPAAGEEAEK